MLNIKNIQQRIGVLHRVVKSDYDLQEAIPRNDSLARLRYVERFPTIANSLGTLHE